MTAQEYEAWLSKFDTPKTTDECHTPASVYDAIADWVEKEYNVSRDDFIRPFYPNGDYIKEDYTGKIVVDNPPFSLSAKIRRFYHENNVKFFLFAPALTMLGGAKDIPVTYVVANIDIKYANGANVCTGFVTNLGDNDTIIHIAPSLKNAIKEANKINSIKLPKYQYPRNITSSARLGSLGNGKQELKIPRSETIHITGLQSQKEMKKAIFGGGLLVSDRVADLLEKARIEAEAEARIEAEARMVWKFSEREIEQIRRLNQNTVNKN